MIGSINFADLKIVLSEAVMEGEEVIKPAVTWNYGNFIQTIVCFLILAFAIFMMIKALMNAKKKEEETPAALIPTPPELELFTKKKQKSNN